MQEAKKKTMSEEKEQTKREKLIKDAQKLYDQGIRYDDVVFIVVGMK
jgi:hypothetical protein